MKENIELRIRTIRILWLALFISVGLYFAVTFFVPRSENPPATTLFLVLSAVSITTVLASFIIKNNFLSRAVQQQQVQLVQQGYVVACALTEVPALLGLLDYFSTGNGYYYVLFIIAALGMLLHFPRREHVLNAAHKHPGF
jgi:NADH:ubiquinone oxidoreductase subunit 2 (subunit N)